MVKTPSLKPGAKLGPYEIIDLIGKGGMGEVYKAYEPSLDRKVALKIIPRDLAEKDPEVVKRFEAEGKVLAQLSHPNVVVVHSFGIYEGFHTLTMEFVDGPSLKAVIRKKIFDLNEAFPLFLQMLRGTEALHRAGIIHRDLKPSNVICKKDGTIKIVDLGIAKNIEDTDPNFTKVGEVIGSPLYMSPEVASGEPATKQSDIWGLGLIFYEMLVGKNPYKGSSQSSIFKKIMTSELDFPKEIYQKYPKDVLRTIKKLFSRNPSDRFQTVTEALREFEAKVGGAQKADPAFDTTITNSDVSQVISKTVELKRQGNASQFISNHSSTSATRTTLSAKKKLHKEQNEPDEFHLKIYSLIYMLIIGVVITAFVYWHNKASQEPVEVSTDIDNEAPVSSNNPPISIAIKSPQDKEMFWLEPNQPIIIDYAISGTPSELHLQIASDSSFSNIDLDVDAPPQPFQVTQLEPEKTYHLRFKFKTDEAFSYSDPISFTISLKQPPKLLSPANLFTYFISDPLLNETSVELQWQHKASVERYRIQIAKDPDFQHVVMDKSSPNTTLNDVSLPIGSYFWRVRTIGENPISDIWSSALSFNVVKPSVEKNLVSFQPESSIPPQPSSPTPLQSKVTPNTKMHLEAPHLIKSKISTVLVASDTGRTPATFVASTTPIISWEKVKGANIYNVQISKNANFTHLIVDSFQSQTSFQWTNISPGTYFFRVFAKNTEGSSSRSSAIGSIEALIAAPTIEKSFKMVAMPGKSNQFSATVLWSPLPLARAYLIKLSKNLSFTESVRTFRTSTTTYVIETDSPNQQFITVAALNENGQIISEFSKPATLIYEDSTPLEIPKIVVPSDRTVLGSVPSPNFPVVFRWNSSKMAQSYELQFAKDFEFQNMIYSKKVKDTLWLLKKNLPSGKIYWRLRAQRGSTFSPWTHPYSLEVPENGK